MAAILDNLRFSSSFCIQKIDTHGRNFPKIKRFHKFRIEMQKRESKSPIKRGINGVPNGIPLTIDSNGQIMKLKNDSIPITMIPISEAMKKMNASEKRSGILSRLKQIVKRETTTAMVKPIELQKPSNFPQTEELNVLPSDESFSWATEDYNPIQRTINLCSFVVSLHVRLVLDNSKWSYPRGFTHNNQKTRRRKTASWLREQVLQLGPTFIKIGQLSSTRSDLFPHEIVTELAKLQDRVPAFSSTKAKCLIERELGSPVHELFKEFEDEPIAAASLGQVHRAILHNGEKVVVKVQRPGLKKLFDIDLRVLKLVAEYFENNEILCGLTKDWVGIYDECAKILYQEIDYINEAKNAERFRRDFRNIKWVRVPQVFWDYTAVKVLTLEYVPGIKINNLEAIDKRGYSRSQISSRAIEAYLIQILKTGFFHADPHPGNLAIDVDESLIYYDFGMMGEVKSLTRDKIFDLFYAVYEKDEKKVMNSLISLGAIQPTGDMLAVRRSVKFFMENSLNQMPSQQTNLAAISEDLFAIATDQPFRFPATFIFVIRAFSTLEGIGYALDPKFSFIKIAAPYAQELLYHKQTQHTGTGTHLLQEIQKQADNARSYTMSMPYRVHRIEEFIKQLDSGDLKLHVRVLESERAAQKATILQMATMYTVIWTMLINLGVMLICIQGNLFIANGSFIGAGFLLALFLMSMHRVKMLDDFKKMI
ncbi:hypothetical protein LXL04_017663 [Taraxacum kok-saghyz]